MIKYHQHQFLSQLFDLILRKEYLVLIQLKEYQFLRFMYYFIHLLTCIYFLKNLCIYYIINKKI